MRIITIDNGNTNPHAGIFVEGNLTEVIPVSDFRPLEDDFVVASNVGKPLSVKVSYDLSLHRPVKNNPHYFEMPVHYSEALGDDRMIAAYGVFQELRSSQDKILIIDAGTFMTMDLVSAEGFLGGYIFPGLNTFLKSYQSGAQLPSLKWETPLHLTSLPHSTDQAILGALELFLSATIIEVIKKTSPNKIILTGGSAEKIIKYFLILI